MKKRKTELIRKSANSSEEQFRTLFGMNQESSLQSVHFAGTENNYLNEQHGNNEDEY